MLSVEAAIRNGNVSSDKVIIFLAMYQYFSTWYK